VNDLEDFDDIQLPRERPLPEEQPGWARALAWATIALGAVYIINPTAGIFELVPDMMPVVGNLDEAAVMFLIFGALRYLGVRLPDFVERWARPAPRLPSSTERDGQ
jgi:hypothetical protein